MEIRIDVPPFLHSLVEWMGAWLVYLSVGWNHVQNAASIALKGMEQVLHLPRNALLTIFAIALVFWPILLSLGVALASASAFIFWLITSAIFGILQLMYVTYQFVMIACNIFGISILKTYSMLRNQVLYYLDRSSIRLRGKSRRRLWRQRIEQAPSYEEFLKIRIESKDPTQVLSEKHPEQPADAALPPLHRSVSFSCGDSPSRSMTRSRSFSGEVQKELEKTPKADPVVIEELGEKTADLLVTTTQRLKEARFMAEVQQSEEAANSLKYLLSGVIKRNHLNLDDHLIQNALSVDECGQYGLTNKTRRLIRAYYEEVEGGLDWIAHSPLLDTEPDNKTTDSWAEQRPSELVDRTALVRKMTQNTGRTALMLSGGGAIAMYHLGVIRALIESKLYQDIKVVSGTSGGSISAAMCAIKTPEELYNEVCVSIVSTDYLKTGEMKKKNIRWFPPIMDMASYWLKNKLLVDSAEFRRTCEFYYSDFTFEEAFERTGKHVCITVSAYRPSGDSAQRLLLNHISTPHVTIASAVAASCALPGVMAPAKLLAKNSNGVIEPFEVDGVEWIDGSVQADLPFQRIATLFAVTSFIVSQTNFHIVPFMYKAHHPSQKSLYWRLFQTMEWDVRNRCLKLSKLGLFPRIFGVDIHKVFKQKYHGNLTIVPRFTTMQTLGLKALSNPTVKDMEGYLKYGQLAIWPYLNAVRDMIRLEKALDECLITLEQRVRELHPDVDWSNHDDVESIASSSLMPHSSTRVRIIGRPPSILASRDREAEQARRKMSNLEQENQALKEQLAEMQKLLAQKGVSTGESPKDEKESENEEKKESTSSSVRASVSDGAEGGVWNLVLRSTSPNSTSPK